MDALARIMMVIVLLSSVFWATPAADGSWEFEAKLRASVPAAGDMFGTAVALCEGTAVIGAPFRDPGPDRGAAYIFEEGGGVWTQTRFLYASIDWAPYDFFGSSVAVVPDHVVVGAPNDDPSGSAYCFWKIGGGWQTDGKLLGDDGASGPFGQSVAMSGNMVLVGAPWDGAGSAYLFEKVGGVWTQTAKLVTSHAEPGDCFGWSVALCGDVALIGAPGDDSFSGSAYVFQRFDPYWLVTKLDDGEHQAPGDSFGFSVALWGDVALIGAPGDNPLVGPDRGTVCVFQKTPGWQRVARLAADDGVANAEFGASVDLYKGFEDAPIALVGAPGDDDHGTCSGSAYLFENIDGDWTQMAKLTASDGAAGDRFGSSVAVSYSASFPHPVELLIGAPDDDSFSGSAYVFVGSDCNESGSPDDYDIAMGWSEDCQPNGIPDECDIADGTSQDCQSDGIPDECQLEGNDCNANGIPDDCDIADGTSEDCNENGVPDECDIADGTSQDANGNGIPDECECFGDLDGDSDVDLSDLAQLLAHYGEASGMSYEEVELDADGDVDLADLAALLAVYGTTCE
jgi:hypothetical protein